MKEKSFQIKQIGLKNSPFQDLYYRVLKMSWPTFLLIAGFFYILLNFGFGFLYYFGPAEILNARQDSLWDTFVFSFQTSSTLGYGHLRPNSDTTHAIVVLDTLMGIFYVAIITGLAFAKFAKPNSKILFSKNIIWTKFDGVPALMFRIANGRDTNVLNANVEVAALLPYTSTEGHTLKRFYHLDLLTSNSPTFSLTWTLIHKMDKDSPLYEKSFKELQELGSLYFVSFTGIDVILSQTIHAHNRFTTDKLVKAKKFTDILDGDTNSNFTIDFTKFHSIEEE